MILKNVMIKNIKSETWLGEIPSTDSSICEIANQEGAECTNDIIVWHAKIVELVNRII